MAANTKDTVITGKLAERLVAWCKIEAELEGLIDNDTAISDTRVTNVWDEHYRVNLYKKYLPPTNSLVPDYRIVSSYLLRVDHNGKVWNKTRRASSAYSG